MCFIILVYVSITGQFMFCPYTASNVLSCAQCSVPLQQCAILCTVFCPLVAMCYPAHALFLSFTATCYSLHTKCCLLHKVHKVFMYTCTLLKFILANCVLLSALSVLAVIFIIPAHNVLPFYTMCHPLQTLYGHLHIMIFCMYTQSKAQQRTIFTLLVCC